jgi:hypothetical protein
MVTDKSAQQSEAPANPEKRRIDYARLDRVEDALHAVLHDPIAYKMFLVVELVNHGRVPPVIYKHSEAAVLRELGFGFTRRHDASMTRRKIASLFDTIYYNIEALPFDWWGFNRGNLLRLVALFGVLHDAENSPHLSRSVPKGIPYVLGWLSGVKEDIDVFKKESTDMGQKVRVYDIFDRESARKRLMGDSGAQKDAKRPANNSTSQDTPLSEVSRGVERLEIEDPKPRVCPLCIYNMKDTDEETRRIHETLHVVNPPRGFVTKPYPTKEELRSICTSTCRFHPTGLHTFEDCFLVRNAVGGPLAVADGVYHFGDDEEWMTRYKNVLQNRAPTSEDPTFASLAARGYNSVHIFEDKDFEAIGKWDCTFHKGEGHVLGECPLVYDLRKTAYILARIEANAEETARYKRELEYLKAFRDGTRGIVDQTSGVPLCPLCCATSLASERDILATVIDYEVVRIHDTRHVDARIAPRDVAATMQMDTGATSAATSRKPSKDTIEERLAQADAKHKELSESMERLKRSEATVFLLAGTRDGNPYVEAIVSPSRDVPQCIATGRAGIEHVAWSFPDASPEKREEVRAFLDDPKWVQSGRRVKIEPGTLHSLLAGERCGAVYVIRDWF